MDTGVGHQNGLELCQIDVEGTIKPQGSCDGADVLTNKPVQVGVGWPFDVQVTPTDIVDGFVVKHESAVRVLQGSVGSQNGIIGLNNSMGQLKKKKYQGHNLMAQEDL